MLRKHSKQVLAMVLLAQAGVYYAWSGPETVPAVSPLAQFPATLGEWELAEEGVIEQEIREKLKADDLLDRFYAGPGKASANLFIAYFRSQRTGQSPHSPKNCLPGSGWIYTRSGTISVPVEVGAIRINRYMVTKGEHASLVLYWYHSPRRVVASEYWAKIWLVLDSIRYDRSDTALVRVWTPVLEGREQEAEQAAIRFVQAAYPHLAPYFPR
jgi:EpsI family protein